MKRAIAVRFFVKFHRARKCLRCDIRMSSLFVTDKKIDSVSHRGTSKEEERQILLLTQTAQTVRQRRQTIAAAAAADDSSRGAG